MKRTDGLDVRMFDDSFSLGCQSRTGRARASVYNMHVYFTFLLSVVRVAGLLYTV